MLQNGQFRVDFSETLYKLPQIKVPEDGKRHLIGENVQNMTFLNDFKDFILEVNFTSSIEGDVSRLGQNASKLLSWKFINFTQFYLDLEVNFKNPLLVSSFSEKDTIQFKVLSP